jgi:pimeloyl-ACP methyl ester carboxylesterase
MKFLLPLLLPLALIAQEVKRIPPLGIEVPAADRAEIETGLKQLAAAISPLRQDAKLASEIPNVEIFFKSADWALRYGEFFDLKQIPIAKDHIKQGLDRAAALAKGETPWNSQTGRLVRAYRSNIDGSVQPYGLVIPENWGKAGAKRRPFRLDFWCHGRGEKLSELAFIADRQKNPGEFVPEGAIVCHLYGRYCNANKFAGETDLFEALEDIKQHYPIDERRLVIRGFSMGGASTWQFATHFPGVWAAAAPGAGFAETAEFFKAFAPGKEAPPAWEQKLWRWYDCTTMAANLANLSVVAYSGEIDPQKQAADIMVKYAAQEGLTFPHIIGPQTAHKYHPASKPEIEELVTTAVEKVRQEIPKQVRFSTYTLVYPQAHWVKIERMEKQWERADVNAEISDSVVNVRTKNVAALTLNLSALVFDLDGQRITLPAAAPTSNVTFQRRDGKWIAASDQDLHAKKHAGYCGPIDHAFMSRFVFVRPTGKPLNEAVGAWTKAEMDRAIIQWRQVFRGDAPVKDDTALTADEIKNCNLVIWGDPSSNQLFNHLATLSVRETGHHGDPLSLPFQWSASQLAFRGVKYDAATHVPILIFPNPLNPSRYIVLNSGFTFREAAALNNSDQTPKLPDWAVVDLRTPPGPKWPGKIVDAGFFDENWQTFNSARKSLPTPSQLP